MVSYCDACGTTQRVNDAAVCSECGARLATHGSDLLTEKSTHQIAMFNLLIAGTLAFVVVGAIAFCAVTDEVPLSPSGELSQSNGPWIPYESSQGRFRCDFPEEPAVQQGWRGQQSTWAHCARENSTEGSGKFTVFYRDLPEDEAEDVSVAMEQALNLIETPATETETEDVSVDGFLGQHIEWWNADHDRFSSIRLFVANGRLFGLLSEEVGEDNAQHFNNKFRLVAEDEAAEPTAQTADQPEPSMTP